jgi:3',5'-cyclic AMP phosphodiesterase CpdA
VPVVVHLSDIHFGAHSPALAESLLADIDGVGPDLVVISGDLTQRARPDQFTQARAFIDRLPGAVLTVVGNHDLPLVDLPRRLLSGTRRYERSITADLDPVVAVDGVVALGLDTMPRWRWKAGHVSPRQAALVRSTLGTAAPRAWRLLVTHHPVLPSHRSGLVGRSELATACADAGVAVLLAGHTHTPSADIVDLDGSGARHRALALVSGTAISSRTRGASNAYEVLRLDGPMVPGARVTVEIREPAAVGWTVARAIRFGFAPEGIVAVTPAD